MKCPICFNNKWERDYKRQSQRCNECNTSITDFTASRYRNKLANISADLYYHNEDMRHANECILSGIAGLDNFEFTTVRAFLMKAKQLTSRYTS